MAPYSASARAGRFVSTAGHLGYLPDKTLASGFQAQARQALDNLMLALKAAGASEADVVNVNVFLADGADFEEMNTIYREYFRDPYPTRTTIVVGLRPGVQFEVNAQAVLDTNE